SKTDVKGLTGRRDGTSSAMNGAPTDWRPDAHGRKGGVGRAVVWDPSRDDGGTATRARGAHRILLRIRHGGCDDTLEDE
ncbi:hypothetical protein OIV41_05355, partial [Burkholderia pseudomallei]|nr:hypothetical protein [Burkholderia pseudomallei]